jgi:hypothetical protein
MTDLVEATDDAADNHPDEDTTSSGETPAETPAETTSGPEAEAEDRESQQQTAEAASETAGQAAQDSLFTTDPVPAVNAAEQEDEGVTTFGGEPDDLDTIRAELGTTDTPEEAEPAPDVTLVAAVAAAEGAAEEEAAEAIVEAGVPEGSDDDPEAVEALLDAEAEAEIEPLPRDRWLSVPFYVYLGVWLVFSIAMVVVLRDSAVAGGGALVAAPAYPAFIFAGFALAVAGPLLSIAVWLLARARSSAEERRGLLAIALLRGALSTFAGVAMWWIALVVLNYFKTGRFF